MSGCFDQLPATLERLLTGQTDGQPLLHERADRVVLVYLDAFGWRFVERQESHPLLERARADGIARRIHSQFPSTTTAHVTTIHTGLPVADHGLYEWHVYEPSLDRLVTPLLYSFSGDHERDTLAGVLEPHDLYPAGGLYPRLRAAGVELVAVQPAAIARSIPNSVLLEGVRVLPYADPAEGLAAAAAALDAAERGYAFVYLDAVDTFMHLHGSEHPEVDDAFAAQLTAVIETRFPPGTLVLLTADHGMTPVDPARTYYVNEVWPELGDHLRRGADGKPLAPAGSCRDLFLHVLDGELETVRDELGARLDGVAEVVDTRTFFPAPPPALARRLAELVVLPVYGEAVWWHEPGRFDQHLHAQHGGLTPHEREIPLLGYMA